MTQSDPSSKAAAMAVPGPSLLSVSACGPVLQAHTTTTNGATRVVSPFMDGVYFLPPSPYIPH